MTLMPFLLAFLVIFGIASQGVFESYLDFSSTQKNSKTFFDLQRDLQNQEQKYYRDHSDNKNAQKKTGSPQKHSTPKLQNTVNIPNTANTPKEKTVPWQRLNVASLFSEEKDEQLQKIFQLLISTVYKELIKKKSVPKFIEELIRMGKTELKKFPNNLYFEKICFETLSFQDCWYQMLKGTQNYSFEHQVGYPSILDLIEYLPEKKLTIALPYSHPEIDAILFDRNFTLAWLKQQKDKKFPKVAEEKFYALTKEKHTKYDSQIVTNLISFPKKRERSKEEVLHAKNSFLKKKIYNP